MRLPGLENVLEIRSGVSANLALLSDSTVVSWGIGGCGVWLARWTDARCW